MSRLPCPPAITLHQFYFLFSLLPYHIQPQLPCLVFSNFYWWTVLLPTNANLLKSKSLIQLYHKQPEILHCIHAKSRDPATAHYTHHKSRSLHWRQPPACISACWGLPLLLLHRIAWCHSSRHDHSAQKIAHNSSRVGRSYQLMPQHQGDGLHGERSLGKFVTAEPGCKLQTKSNLNITVVRIC